MDWDVAVNEFYARFQTEAMCIGANKMAKWF
jgi:hypothetical protein